MAGAVKEQHIQIDTLNDQSAKAIEAAKAALPDVGIAAQSVYFEEQATEHQHAGRLWLAASIALLGLIVAAAYWSVRYYLYFAPPAASALNVRLVAAKVVLFFVPVWRIGRSNA